MLSGSIGEYLHFSNRLTLAGRKQLMIELSLFQRVFGAINRVIQTPKAQCSLSPAACSVSVLLQSPTGCFCSESSEAYGFIQGIKSIG